MANGAGVIIWFRRDLRLDDHPALVAACADAKATGSAVLPVFIHDETIETLGAAARWRLGLSVAALAKELEQRGSRLILRRGPALEVLRSLIAETGAEAVHWTRYYTPDHIARDTEVKSALKAVGIKARSFEGALLHEPRAVLTGAGTAYSVFTPFFKAVRARDPGPALPTPTRIPAPARWPQSDGLSDWRMGAAMNRGAAIVAAHQSVGEAAALARLAAFLDDRLGDYARLRDHPAAPVTSGLSENLAWGEISARRVWQAARLRADLMPECAVGAEKFLSELGWREFAWHLMAHRPTFAHENWRQGWDGFPWRGDNDDAERWRRAMTGEPMVDAGLREMYVTGRMHNRVRMLVASYLTKHLLTDWRVGLRWFQDCLTDWDPAANALGWQWVAGSGPDAAPYFRIFNPATQGERFDPDQSYRRRFLDPRSDEARSFYDAIPRSWGQSPTTRPPRAIVDLADGRNRALRAYEGLKQSPQ